MSVIARGIRTIDVTLLGQELSLKLNNAVWVKMLSKYKLTESEFAKRAQESHIIYSIKFIVCILEANGIRDIKEKDLIEEADAQDIESFMIAYNAIVGERSAEKLKELQEKGILKSPESEEDEDEEGK